MKNISLRLATAMALVLMIAIGAQSRELVKLNDLDWHFAPGHTDPMKDWGCGSEYFSYLTKVNLADSLRPYSQKFNDSSWVTVTLPHDFVVDLPFSPDASHSHGYRTVGYKYPESSVGWYRTKVPVEAADSMKRIWIRFDGIFRDSRVWFNGFYLGGEQSGYAEQAYDVTPYVNFGGDNFITVRADATLEEGWFYEGGGIYRDVWLEKSPSVRIDPRSIVVEWLPEQGGSVRVRGKVINDSGSALKNGASLKVKLHDKDGNPVAGASEKALQVAGGLLPKDSEEWNVELIPGEVELWSPDSPTLYNINIELSSDGGKDVEQITTGFRSLGWSADNGLTINGKNVKILGADLHQDHAGVGIGIPDAVNIYRLKTLKDMGFNAIRSSHNPASAAFLSAADSLGMLIVEENRLLGINDYHVGQLRKMIDRDRNHPSVILWSVGNEEWGVEWDPRGARIVDELREVCHRFDPTRLMTVATSSGPTVIETSDVAGYNYIVQNPIDSYRSQYPARLGFGSEETTGCGTRGVYFDDRAAGHMASLNRVPDAQHDSCLNRIGRGWEYYRDRPWLAGLCYWTGFDYRGEPNPLVYPATGSEFGILDYCGFPKDEAWYIKAQWTDEPVLHLLPHWNLEGHEGEEIEIWAYTNLDEVELKVNGRNLGRQKVEPGKYASWRATYHPGKIEAKGYRGGKKVATEIIETAGPAVKADATTVYEKDGVRIVNVSLRDARGRFAPIACNDLKITLPEGSRLIGAGNGDPAFRGKERPSADEDGREFTFPAFNGNAQFIILGDGEEISVMK